MVVVGILAAAFVGMLGVTAIGGKNYFFRDSEIEIGITVDNDKNLIEAGSLEDAYRDVEKELGTNILKLRYMPEGMLLRNVEITKDKVLFIFDYQDKAIHFAQEIRKNEASVGINSDRIKVSEKIYNEWISQDIIMEEEFLDDGSKGYSFALSLDSLNCRFSGQIDKDEVVKIMRYLNF